MAPSSRYVHLMCCSMLVLASACAKDNWLVRMESGTYEYFGGEVDGTLLAVDAAQFQGAQLTIADGVGSATITFEGSTTELTLELLEPDAWATGCYTMNSHADQESYRVTPDSLSVGTIDFTNAVLIADDCVDGVAEKVVLTQVNENGNAIGCDSKRCIEFKRRP